MFITIRGTVAADVPNGGTLTVSLPVNSAGQDLSSFQTPFPVTGGDFQNAFGHRLTLGLIGVTGSSNAGGAGE